MINKPSAEELKSFFITNKQACTSVLQVISMLDNKTRLQIICLLSQGDFCVGDIVEATGGKVSNISQQLKLLNISGYLEKKRDKKNIIYSLADKRLKGLIKYLQKQYI